MDRRTFLAGAAAIAAAPAAPAAAAPGSHASQSLAAAFRSAQAISEGSGRGTVHVLFAPWCHVSASVYRESRAFLGRLNFRWIPFSGGQPEGSLAVERLLAQPFPSSLPLAFTPLSPLGSRPHTPMADAQDAAVMSTVQPALLRDTGGGLVSPTLLYELPDGRVRVFRGGIGAETMEEVARAAA